MFAVKKFFYKKTKNEKTDLLEEFVNQLQEQFGIYNWPYNAQKAEDAMFSKKTTNRLKVFCSEQCALKLETPIWMLFGEWQVLTWKNITVKSTNEYTAS